MSVGRLSHLDRALAHRFRVMGGWARGAGASTGGLLTFALVSGLQLAQINCGTCHFFSAAFSSRLEAMVGGALARASALRIGLGVGRALIASGSRTHPSHSCDGWVGDLGFVFTSHFIDS